MGYNLITNVKSCYVDVPQILYYSHIPTIIFALIIGFFVFVRNRKLIESRILFLLSIFFSMWSIFDLVTWLAHSSQSIMFSWMLVYLCEALVFIFSLYFAYSYVNKKDVPFAEKCVAILFLSPILILMPSTFSAKFFSITSCEAVQGNLIYYLYFFEGLFFLWTITFLIRSYIKAEKESKKQILLFSLGVILFLLAFSWANITGNITTNWEVTQYGLFGMPIFLGFLAYLIVKFKAFNIKLLGAQALVATLVILIGSQFFFIQNNTNRILTGITLILSAVFGWFLIKSVKLEVQRKEELQMMSDKLAQANDQLRKLDNAKSEFISIASHQLRTPLTAIKGFVSLLLEGSYGKLDAKQEDVLNKVYTSNDRLVNLVEDLLNISRIESGRMEFKFAPWKVEDICQEVVDTFVLRAKEHNLYLEYKKPETAMPEILIDGGKVREVISNMVDNAIKYTPKGGVTIRIEKVFGDVQKVESIEGAIRVIVSDTGIGVPQEELPYLFAKFSRGKDTTRLNTGGTGLGLYVGQSMIENNGGKIWAESDGANLGSRFIIELPIQQNKELLERWG